MKKAKPKNWYYKILQVAKRELGMSEDAYRDVLADCGATEKNGKVSASTMTVPQLEQALSHLQSCGFKIKRTQIPFKEAQLNKCKSIWAALHKAGVMRNPYSEESLSKFAYRITKSNHIRWATPTGMAQTIEALKDMAKRERVSIETV